MNKPMLLILGLACTATSTACDRPDAACERIDLHVRGVRLQSSRLQGVQLQGIELNGREHQGKVLNGRYLNSRWLNSKWLNSRYLNTKYLNGHRLEGVRLAGLSIADVEVAEVVLRGTALQGLDSEGHLRWHGSDWRGTTLSGLTDAGEVLELVIDDVRPHATREDVEYYVLTLDGVNLCGSGGHGVFVPGVWDETGAWRAEGHDGFSTTFSCTTGVIAKCIEWGYTPYDAGPSAHQTCTRLARADYCGDGVSYTKDGTEIDVFDALGIMRPDDGVDMRFEAGWGPDGAVCVDAPRYDMVEPDGDELLPPCWAELPRCASEAEAVEHGALLANRSWGDLRSVCEP